MGVSYSSKKHAETILLAYPDDELNLVDVHIHIARDAGENTDHLTPLDQLWGTQSPQPELQYMSTSLTMNRKS